MRIKNKLDILQKSSVEGDKQNPLITIVIPVYNREMFICEAIESALKQTYKNIEIVVIDNNSSDRTLTRTFDLVSENSKVTIVKNSKNVGPVLNWLEGVHLSKGSYIKILFSDDILMPTCVSELYEALEFDSGCSLSSCLVGENISKSKVKWKLFNKDNKCKSRSLFIRYLVTRSFVVSPCAALFRKKDILFSLQNSVNNVISLESFKTGAGPDVKIYLDILQKYPYFSFIKNPQVFFRIHDRSFTIGKLRPLVNFGYKKTFEYVVDRSTLTLQIIAKGYYFYKSIVILKNLFLKVFRKKS